MLESPRNRINGTDEFMVQRSAARILEEMQKSGWTQGEAELLPKYLESAIKQNSERIRKLKPYGMSGMVYGKGTWSVCVTTAMRQCMDTGNQRRKKL